MIYRMAIGGEASTRALRRCPNSTISPSGQGAFFRHGEAVPETPGGGATRRRPRIVTISLRPAIPRRVARQQSPLPLHRLPAILKSCGGVCQPRVKANKNLLDTALRFQRCASPPDPQRLQRRLHLRFRDYSQVIASRSGKFPDGDFRGACWLEGDFQQFWRIHRLAIRKGHLSFQIQVSTYLSWFPSSPSRV